MFKGTQNILLAGVAGVLIGLVPHAAMALEDENTSPGAMCQPASSADPVSRDASGGMLNASTRPQDWICPIVRDVTRSRDQVEFAAITVIGSTASSCTFRSMTFEGQQVAARDPNNVVSLGNNRRRLQYAARDENIPNAPAGYYHFVCRIQASSGVVTYTVTENDGES